MTLHEKIGRQLADRLVVNAFNVRVSHVREQVGDCFAVITDTNGGFLGNFRIMFDPNFNITSINPPLGKMCGCE